VSDVLRAEHVTVRFGGVDAVSDVDFRVAAHEIVGLIGPNGSGKTTLLNALTGIVAARGDLEVEGRPVRLTSPSRSRRAGILRVFQAPQTFDELSCLENVLLSNGDRRLTGLAASVLLRPLALRRDRQRWADAERALARVGLEGTGEREAGTLTYGQRRLLELARAINADPTVLLLDEPSAGLNDAETIELAKVIRSLNAAGLPIVLVDHKVDVVDSLCSRVVVLELGRVIADGPPGEIWKHQRVIDAYLGVVSDA
jgi:ABC-type branched-subunit amino acid transport system ATPase component